MRRVISYSLYGTDSMYLHGAIRNAEQARLYYPDFDAVFYTGKSVPYDVRDLLQRHATVISLEAQEGISARFWRFYPIIDSEVEIVLIRDCDSRLGEREQAAVAEWMRSGKDFHIMRDHPLHQTLILAGMWGVRTHAARDILTLASSWIFSNVIDEDQRFLERHIYPRARKNACVHDSCCRYEPLRRNFPTRRNGLEFVGEPFDEFDRPIGEHREMLAAHENNIAARCFLQLKTCIKGFMGRS